MATEEQKRAYQEYERKRKAGKAAASWVSDACEAKDLEQLKELFRTGQLDLSYADNVMGTTIGDQWHEGTRALLKLGADPTKHVSKLVWAQSLIPFRVFAEFGANFKLDGEDLMLRHISRHDILEFLLEHGVDVNAPLANQNSPSHRDGTNRILNFAAWEEDVNIFDFLVSRGADYTRTIGLHRAASCKDRDKGAAMITHLIQKYHMNPNMDETANGLIWSFSPVVGSEGGPLRQAAAHSNAAAVEVLLKFGAEPTEISMDAAIEECEQALPIVKLLLDAGVDLAFTLRQAVAYSNLDVAIFCLEKGADPDEADKYQRARQVDRTMMLENMSQDMENLLKEWKAKRETEAKEKDLTDKASKIDLENRNL